MIDFENSSKLLVSLNTECNKILTETKQEFGTKIVMQSQDRIHHSSWPEGVELLTIKDSDNSKPLLYLIKYKSDALIWFEYFVPKVKNSKLQLIQKTITSLLDDLSYQDKGVIIKKLTSIKLKDLKNSNPKSIGIKVFVYISTFLVLSVLTFLAYAIVHLDSVAFAGCINLFSASAFACFLYITVIEPIPYEKKYFPSSIVTSKLLDDTIKKVTHNVNQQLISNSIPGFCHLAVYEINGYSTNEVINFKYDKYYYLVDMQSKIKVAKFKIINTTIQDRIIYTPLIKSDSNNLHIGYIYLELIDIETHEHPYYLNQLSTLEIAKSNPSIWSKLILESSVSKIAKFGGIFAIILAFTNYSFQFVLPNGITDYLIVEMIGGLIVLSVILSIKNMERNQ